MNGASLDLSVNGIFLSPIPFLLEVWEWTSMCNRWFDYGIFMNSGTYDGEVSFNITNSSGTVILAKVQIHWLVCYIVIPSLSLIDAFVHPSGCHDSTLDVRRKKKPR